MQPSRAAKQEAATGGSRASVRVGASAGSSGKQNSGAPERAAGARSDGACRVRGSERLEAWRLERRQERPAAERTAGSLRAAGDLQALGGDAGWRGWPASEPGRTSCTSTPGSRASAGTPTDSERLRVDDEQGSAAAGRGPAVEGAADGAGDLAGTARPWRAFSKRRRAAGVLARARSGGSWTQGQARPAERAHGGICSRVRVSTGRARATARGAGSPERGGDDRRLEGREEGWRLVWESAGGLEGERKKNSVALVPC